MIKIFFLHFTKMTNTLNSQQQKYADLATKYLDKCNDKYMKYSFILCKDDKNEILFYDRNKNSCVLKGTCNIIGYIHDDDYYSQFMWPNTYNEEEYQVYHQLIDQLRNNPRNIFQHENTIFPNAYAELWFLGKIINTINCIKYNITNYNSDVKKVVKKVIPYELDYTFGLFKSTKIKNNILVLLITNIVKYKQDILFSTINTNFNILMTCSLNNNTGKHHKLNAYKYTYHTGSIKSINGHISELSDHQREIYRNYVLPYYLPFLNKFYIDNTFLYRLRKGCNMLQFIKIDFDMVKDKQEDNIFDHVNMSHVCTLDILFYLDLRDDSNAMMTTNEYYTNCHQLTSEHALIPDPTQDDFKSQLTTLCYAGKIVKNIVEKNVVNDFMLATFKVKEHFYAFSIIHDIATLDELLPK